MLENAVLNPIHEKTTILITEPLKTPLHKTNLNIETQRIRLQNKLQECSSQLENYVIQRQGSVNGLQVIGRGAVPQVY